MGLLNDLKSNTFNNFGILHAMVYSNLAPVAKLLEGDLLMALGTIFETTKF